MRNCVIAALVWAALAAAPAALPHAAAAPEGDSKEKKARPIGVPKGLFVGAIETSLWTVVVFITLFLVLRRYAWGPIVEGLNKREQTIAHDKAEADRARQEANQMRDVLASERARADEQIRLMMEKARTDAAQTAADLEAQGRAALAADKERLKREMALQEDQARKEIFDQGAQLATLISAKVVKKQFSLEDHRALLDEALNEFRASGGGGPRPDGRQDEGAEG